MGWLGGWCIRRGRSDGHPWVLESSCPTSNKPLQQLSETGQAIKEGLGQGGEKVKEGAQQTGHRVQEAGQSGKHGAQETWEKTKHKAQESMPGSSSSRRSGQDL